MKKRFPFFHLTYLILTGVALSILPLHPISAQTENPAQRSVQRIVQPAPVQSIDADIVPLFWKAKLSDSLITVPLRNVKFYGVQDYVVDGATRVRELTISTNARSLVRIYHIQPLTAVSNVTDKIQTLRNIAERKTGGDEKRPVKIFPATTHVHMVEYRIEDRDSIARLYEHLESTMIESHARFLVPEQRGDTVREIEVQE